MTPCIIFNVYRISAISVILLSLPVILIAAPLTIDPVQQFQFSQHLFETGQYQRAAEEFDRFSFFFEDDPRQRQSIFKAGHAYLMAGDAVTAIDRLNALTQQGPLDAIAVDAYFLMAECYLVLHSSDQAIMQMRNLIILCTDQHVIDSAYLRMGWIQIQRLDWEGAQQTIAKISEQGRKTHNIDDLETELNKVETIPRKIPALAGTLSVVPGIGQLYCGRYEDALSAFIVNGGIAWAAYEAFDNDLTALGSMISLVGLGFYLGNIYGAVSDAHKYNRNKQTDFIDHLKRHVRVGSSLAPSLNKSNKISALTLSVHFDF